jgi:hypothetical protein
MNTGRGYTHDAPTLIHRIPLDLTHLAGSHALENAKMCRNSFPLSLVPSTRRRVDLLPPLPSLPLPAEHTSHPWFKCLRPSSPTYASYSPTPSSTHLHLSQCPDQPSSSPPPPLPSPYLLSLNSRVQYSSLLSDGVDTPRTYEH